MHGSPPTAPCGRESGTEEEAAGLDGSRPSGSGCVTCGEAVTGPHHHRVLVLGAQTDEAEGGAPSHGLLLTVASLAWQFAQVEKFTSEQSEDRAVVLGSCVEE